MRMWNVDPSLLCRQHLLGEHVEMHMFAGAIRLRTSVLGYLERGLVETGKIGQRHDELVAEMEKRGMNHRSPLAQPPTHDFGEVDSEANLTELARRCPACATLQGERR